MVDARKTHPAGDLGRGGSRIGTGADGAAEMFAELGMVFTDPAIA